MDKDGGFLFASLGAVKVDQSLAAGLCGAGYGCAKDSQELVLDGAKDLGFQMVIGGAANEPHEVLFRAHRTPSRDRLPRHKPGAEQLSLFFRRGLAIIA
jgi:hypothetical protein